MTWKCNACLGTYIDTEPDGMIYQHVCGPLSPDAQGVEHERPNKRNENISLDRLGRPQGIVAAGAGVTPLGGQKTADPAWIIAMREKYAADIAAEA